MCVCLSENKQFRPPIVAVNLKTGQTADESLVTAQLKADRMRGCACTLLLATDSSDEGRITSTHNCDPCITVDCASTRITVQVHMTVTLALPWTVPVP